MRRRWLRPSRARSSCTRSPRRRKTATRERSTASPWRRRRPRSRSASRAPSGCIGSIPRRRRIRTGSSRDCSTSSAAAGGSGIGVAAAAPDSADARPARRAVWPWVVLFLALLFAAGVRWRLRDLPLERDEGEFAYSAQALLRGVPPYRDAYNKKFPGVAIAYAGSLKVFGETAAAVHKGTLLVNAAAILLVFLLARRLSGDVAAACAAVTYALLSLDTGALGLAGHAMHFVVAF